MPQPSINKYKYVEVESCHILVFYHAIYKKYKYKLKYNDKSNNKYYNSNKKGELC